MFELGQTITHYEVTGLLGPLLGGELYRGVQTKTGLGVSLWTVGAALLPSDAARRAFVARAARTYGVRHPNAQGLVDLFVHGDVVVVVGAATSGVSLTATMAQKKSLPRAEAFSIIEQVTSAVSQYHQQDIVLGDVLPELVWVQPAGAGAVLGSFGGALLFPRPRFLAVARKARRWSWLAPEIRLGHQGDLRSDVYALAALAHFVLYGRAHPYGDGVRRGMFASCGRWLAFGSRPDAPRKPMPLVDAVLKRALSGYLIDRPREVEMLCEDLRRALASTPLSDGDVAGAPPSAPPLAWEAPPAPSGARTMQAGAPQPVRSVSAEQPRTMMAEAPRNVEAPRAPEQPRTMMAEAPRNVEPPQPRTMMAEAPRNVEAPRAPEQPRTMMAEAPRNVEAPRAPEPQRTMMASAPTPEMLAGIPRAPTPPVAAPPAYTPSSQGAPAAPPGYAPPAVPPPDYAPPVAAPNAPASTVMMSAPTPEMLAGIPGYAPPTPQASPQLRSPSGNHQTQPINLAHLDALLAETSEADKAAAQAPLVAPTVNAPEKKTTEIDSAEVNRLLGEMRRDD